ncbi:TPA: SpoV family signaling peptide [Streptococcus pyogenes]
MKKKLSLFMIATAAVVSLSLATPENQTVSANDTQVTCVGCPDCGPKWSCCPLTCMRDLLIALGDITTLSKNYLRV